MLFEPFLCSCSLFYHCCFFHPLENQKDKRMKTRKSIRLKKWLRNKKERDKKGDLKDYVDSIYPGCNRDLFGIKPIKTCWGWCAVQEMTVINSALWHWGLLKSQLAPPRSIAQPPLSQGLVHPRACLFENLAGRESLHLPRLALRELEGKLRPPRERGERPRATVVSLQFIII